MSTVPAAVLAAVLAVASGVPLLGWALLARPDAAVVATQDNLMRGLPAPVAVTAAPRRSPGAALVGLLTPAGTRARLQRLVARAGHPAAWPVQRLVAAKLVLAAIAVALGVL